MKKNYFENVKCVEELKRQYFALAKKYHSDITGGNDEEMKMVNAEYDVLFKKYKDVHQNVKENAEDEYYTASTPTNEVPEDFKIIVDLLLKLKGLQIELCGRWVWIDGDTKTHKEDLKKMGCKWSQNKKMWSWHYAGDGSGYRKKGTDIKTIRSRYGSTTFRTSDELLLGAGA